ncbi:ABC transporter substrate-binding protein [Gracilimonas mengyeensis]|uniref:Extracellular solute-binding protein, family 5 Middle n=1 Tax=Gracilimonas mengyeensis TaxID=1302730 RepID=A0A521EKH6_9BACT|nr:ABC transporter substrate-binding protein [Gracilimonas mengyeensis]SMO84415.1 extracellular solute-binding protein, family 5 Middle [Gracilimonas mengyeensis]
MKNLLIFLVTGLLLASCGKGPETVTVKTDPSELLGPPPATTTDTTTDDFRQLTLGEVSAIESLDPLFAESDSEFRVLGLVYQGLVSLGDNGQAEPAVASRWEVNGDSTQFTFHLKTNLFFHDSQIFGNGNGRRVVAGDVKYVFERMASSSVPSFAAAKFSDIRGFEQYQNELMYVKAPAKRAINSIEGLKVPNDSTVIFNMKTSAPDFLQRLAHPQASVYAKEAVGVNNAPMQRPAGTGLFQFVKKDGNTLIFTLNQDYPAPRPQLDRLDIVSGLEERDLFQEFARNNLDALIEVSPSTIRTIADSSGALLTNFYTDYTLQKSEVRANYPLFFNPGSDQPQKAKELFSSIESRDLISIEALGDVQILWQDSSSTQTKDSLNTHFTITQSNHPVARYLVGRIAAIATSRGSSFGMSPSLAISDQVTFTTRPYMGTQKILQWNYPLYVLSAKGIAGIQIEERPWKLDLYNVTIEEAEE